MAVRTSAIIFSMMCLMLSGADDSGNDPSTENIKEIAIYSLQKDAKFQRYLKKAPMKHLIDYLIKRNWEKNTPIHMQRLEFILSNKNPRKDEVTQRIKNDLLVWAIDNDEVAPAMINVLLNIGANHFYTVPFSEWEVKSIMCRALDQCLNKKLDVSMRKMLLLLRAGHPKSLKEYAPLLRKKIATTFYREGTDPFIPQLEQWRGLFCWLGFQKRDRKFAPGLTIQKIEDPKSIEYAQQKLKQKSKFEQCAIACEIEFFVLSIARNIVRHEVMLDFNQYFKDRTTHLHEVVPARCTQKELILHQQGMKLATRLSPHAHIRCMLTQDALVRKYGQLINRNPIAPYAPQKQQIYSDQMPAALMQEAPDANTIAAFNQKQAASSSSLI